jgi:hypothetical protein
MKKLIFLAFALSVFTVAGQQTTNPNSKRTPNDQASQTNASANSEQSASGKVSADGKSFVTDKDDKTWTVNNPSALQGYENQHVTLLINVDPVTNTIQIVSLEPQGQPSPQ